MTARTVWCRSGGGERRLGRLLAAGWPVYIGTDGVRLGWVVRDRLFLQDQDRVWMVELPDAAEGVWPDPAGWVVALGQGFVTVDPVRAEIASVVLDDDSDPVGTRVGRDVGVYVEAPSHRAVRLSDGQELVLPDGASRSRWLAPWGTGVGVVWVDMETAYRLSPQACPPGEDRGVRIVALGRVKGALEVCAGPHGAAVIRGRTGSLLVAPRGLGVAGPVLEAVRFSDDGERVLATDDAGALELTLADGKVLNRWPGRFDPVGFLGGAGVLHDHATGAVRTLGGVELAAGFCGAQPVLGAQTLVGPGGMQWTLGDDLPTLGGLVDGLVAVGEGVVAHADEGVRIFVEGRERARIAVDEVVGLSCVGGRVRVETTAGVTVYDVDGNRIVGGTPAHSKLAGVRRKSKVTVAAPEEESEVRIGLRSWPVPADHAVPVGEGVWAWTDDGALYALE